MTFFSGSCLLLSLGCFCLLHFFSLAFLFVTLRVCADLSVREERDEDPDQSDEAEAEMSPPKSPSTPKNVKAKNSGTVP